MMPATRRTSPARAFSHHVLVVLGAVSLSAILFFVLPLIQAISETVQKDSLVRSVDTVQLPPPAAPEPEPEKAKEPEEEPPQLERDTPQLDLAQLDVVLNPGMTGGWMSGNYGIDLGKLTAGMQESAALFSGSDLDQTPRATFQPSPVLTGALRRRTPGRVVVLFVVDERGRVARVKVQDASDRAFVDPALTAVKKWRYEPGKRGGQPVRFRLRQTITFPRISQP